MQTLFALGFRPFFLLAGLSATLLIPEWVAALSGHGLPGVGPGWHAHELVFGYIGAVLAGFFLTAVPKWTRQPPITGAPLAALAALWLAGRLLPGPVDLAFLPVLALAIGVPIWRARSARNALFPLLLLAMGAADLTVHYAPDLAGPAQRAAVFAALGVVVIFGGRIIPLFTRNALKKRGAPAGVVRDRSRLDDAAIASTLALVPLALLPELWAVTALVAGVAALLNGLRMRGWATRRTLDDPILWILHAGYAWVVLACALWALASARPDLLRPSTALHAATAGALGTTTLGMMSRVALGHTGRPLRAAPAMVVGYAAILLSAALRVTGPMLTPEPWVLYGSGAAWTVAFALFTWVYTPILLRPRVDS